MRALTKLKLRRSLIKERKEVDNKEEKDNAIFEALISLSEFQNAKTVLTYASFGFEISTDRIMEYALSIGKTVAAPVCMDGHGKDVCIEFYKINSLDDFNTGAYGIREPDIEKCKKIADFTDSVLIVPALCFDPDGFRLGYGAGYYDRFMENFASISVGLCYNNFIVNKIPTEKHDKSVDIIVTESDIHHCNGGKNG